MIDVDAFRETMRLAGLDYAGPINADGKLHRFRASSDRERNSWYILHEDPPAAGVFGCWRRGMKETWHARGSTLSQADWKTVRRRWAEDEQAAERDKAERQAKAREVAANVLAKAGPVDRNAYLAAKGVQAHSGLRQHAGWLLVPLRDAEGALHSLQFVGPDSTKRFLPCARVSGCFFALADRADGPLVIAEGVATGASIHEATAYAVVCALSAGNLLAVAQAMRAKWPEREFIVAADNDQWPDANGKPKPNSGVEAATAAAKAIRARLAVPQFEDTGSKPTDFNDLHQLEGRDAVRAQIEAAVEVKETDAESFDRLARLAPADYDRAREAEAERLGVRLATLDAEVTARRPSIPNANAQGTTLTFADAAPWPDAVDGAEVLGEIVGVLRRYAVAAGTGLLGAALWAVHSYAYDLGDVSPLLVITSPTKRCGKTRLLTLLARLVHRPLAASSASAAGIYRAIELHHPTLLIDEVDSFLKADEQLRGLIDAGHTREAAYHLGCVKVGDEPVPNRWSTWTPKVLSGIGHLADTLEDRAIVISMRRRKPNEPAERLRYRTRFEDLRRKIARWVPDNEGQLLEANPDVPQELHDRAAENWTPLLAIADLAGGDWPRKAREAALELSGVDGTGAPGVKVELLADIRLAFSEAGMDRLSSIVLCESLCKFEGRPWANFGRHERPLTPNTLANLLREFGVTPDSIAVGDKRPKGYHLAQFEDAFARYLDLPATPTALQSATPQLPLVHGHEIHFSATATCPLVADSEKPFSINNDGPSCGVAVQKDEMPDVQVLAAQADLL